MKLGIALFLLSVGLASCQIFGGLIIIQVVAAIISFCTTFIALFIYQMTVVTSYVTATTATVAATFVTEVAQGPGFFVAAVQGYLGGGVIAAGSDVATNLTLLVANISIVYEEITIEAQSIVSNMTAEIMQGSKQIQGSFQGASSAAQTIVQSGHPGPTCVRDTFKAMQIVLNQTYAAMVQAEINATVQLQNETVAFVNGTTMIVAEFIQNMTTTCGPKTPAPGTSAPPPPPGPGPTKPEGPGCVAKYIRDHGRDAVDKCREHADAVRNRIFDIVRVSFVEAVNVTVVTSQATIAGFVTMMRGCH